MCGRGTPPGWRGPSVVYAKAARMWHQHHLTSWQPSPMARMMQLAILITGMYTASSANLPTVFILSLLAVFVPLNSLTNYEEKTDDRECDDQSFARIHEDLLCVDAISVRRWPRRRRLSLTSTVRIILSDF